MTSLNLGTEHGVKKTDTDKKLIDKTDYKEKVW